MTFVHSHAHNPRAPTAFYLFLPLRDLHLSFAPFCVQSFAFVFAFLVVILLEDLPGAPSMTMASSSTWLGSHNARPASAAFVFALADH